LFFLWINYYGGILKSIGMKKNKFLEGFTLVEILIVVVIIGILATVAIPVYFSYVERGYASDAKVQIKNILSASEIYATENGEAPADVSILVEEQYIIMKKSLENKWEFDVSTEYSDLDGLTGRVTATSLAGMQGGEGKSVTYIIDEGEFVGYGQKREE